MARKKVMWFARGGGIAKMGPFSSQQEAFKALTSVKTGDPVDGAFVWCVLLIALCLSSCSGWTMKRHHVEWPCAGSGCSPLFEETKR